MLSRAIEGQNEELLILGNGIFSTRSRNCMTLGHLTVKIAPSGLNSTSEVHK